MWFKNVYISAVGTLSCDLFQLLLKADMQFMMWVKDRLTICSELLMVCVFSELKRNAMSALPLVLTETIDLAEYWHDTLFKATLNT